ncbi:activator of hsp90 [Cyclospora cayetanensis]|uniref:Activator of hsp90 n=1 Tax=Cyclospora cayetanensis TaxID=88456 RepID=A0A1D3D7H0_9EIME|nr:activator of hsp90 [Cyclospora cayetanensis]
MQYAIRIVNVLFPPAPAAASEHPFVDMLRLRTLCVLVTPVAGGGNDQQQPFSLESELLSLASLSLRKNRKMLFFDLSAEADWTATARDKDGRFLADSRGHMTLKEFSSDDDDCRITFSGDGKVPPQHRIDNAAKKEGPLQVTELLKQFVQEMRSKA